MIDLDMMAYARPLPEIQQLAKRAEAAGLGTLWLTESGRTAYLSCAAAALVTERIGLGTAVAVAFPRSPMITAKVAWELAEASDGRFTLGLGTQIKAHIERRYSAEYLPPGPRMRDYVRALQAIFAAFRGGAARVPRRLLRLLAAPRAVVAGADRRAPTRRSSWPRCCRGCRRWRASCATASTSTRSTPPTTSATTRSPTWPRARGAPVARSTTITFEIPVMTAVGDTAEEIAATREHARTMIAFYGSTRTYSPVFEHHGYDGLSDELHERQREGDIKGMAALITDEILEPLLRGGRLGRPRRRARRALRGSRAERAPDELHRDQPVPEGPRRSSTGGVRSPAASAISRRDHRDRPDRMSRAARPRRDQRPRRGAHTQPARGPQRVQHPDGPRARRRVPRVRRRRRRARRRSDRRRPRVLRRRRPATRRRHVRGARAARVPLRPVRLPRVGGPQAGHRRDQRARGRARPHPRAADRHPARGRGREVRHRAEPARRAPRPPLALDAHARRRPRACGRDPAHRATVQRRRDRGAGCREPRAPGGRRAADARWRSRRTSR